ncbi:hypothetical protein IW492_08645 [Enterococcus sp. BWB1-3]|nr:hypothetical protein [Enterococcus sp. BWB1-3]
MSRIKNIGLFFLLAIVLYSSTYIAMQKFEIINKFKEIEEFVNVINVKTVPFVIYAIQLLFAYISTIIGTLILSIISGWVVKIRMGFRQSFTIVVFANIIGVVLNLLFLIFIDFNNIYDFIKLSLFPSTWIVLCLYYFYYLKTKKIVVNTRRLILGLFLIICLGSLMTISNILTIGGK